MATIAVTVGTVNFTDYVHFTLSKVASPSVIVWEDWVAGPLTNYSFVIPDVDADNYFLRAYDAPDNSSLGTFAVECFVAAGSSEYEYEFRFYEGGNLPAGASLNGPGDVLTDPYLTDKNISTVHKEGFRPLDPANEYSLSGDELSLFNGLTLNIGEKLAVVIKNKVASSSSAGASLYKGTLSVSELTKTITATDKNKLVRLVGTNALQTITLPSLATLAVDDGFYFDNSVGGVAKQPKFLTDSTDRIKFNGFGPDTEFAEFWLDKGAHMLLKKFDDDFWEVRSDYKGANVGESFLANYLSHPNTIPGNGKLGEVAYDGDEYGKLWWWVNNILDASARVSDATVNSTSYTHPIGKEGCWVVHPSLKQFRPPNTQGMYFKGLTSFASPGSDTDRVYDKPGGKQNYAQGEYTIVNGNDGGGTITTDTYEAGPYRFKTKVLNAGKKTDVQNIGKIELYRI
jgi:hypothetical protein